MAAEKNGRLESSIELLAVSKTRGADAIRRAHAAGLTRFGENYLQEALGKMAELKDLPLQWHFIGPIQSNKTRSIAENFSWVHSVDRLKLAQRLSDQRPRELPPLQVCLQFNVSNEASKAGLHAEELAEVADAAAGLPGIQVRGLMAIPAPSSIDTDQRSNFATVSRALDQLHVHHLHLDTLSMGMSSDLEAAIAEGATIVRIGTDIFGARGG